MNVVLTLLGALLGILIAATAVLFLFERLFPAAACRTALALERRRSRLREACATVSGFRIPYLQGGSENAEPLLLIHGFGGDKDNFTRISRFLTPRYRVIIPDLPGFGEAGRDLSASYAMADQVERLRAFLDQLGIRKIHIGGNSMGGFIAAQFSATYPDRVASTWLLDPAGTAASHDTKILHRYLETGDAPLLLPPERDLYQSIDTLLKAAMHRPPFFPHSMRTVLGRRAIADYPLHKRILRQLVESPLLETRYSAIPAPALIVWGQEDQLLSLAGADAFKALFPNSRVDLMPGIGHMPMLEVPKLSAMNYLAFRQAIAK